MAPRNFLLSSLLCTLYLLFASSLDDAEYFALKSIYESTRGEHWTWAYTSLLTGFEWNFQNNENPCSHEHRWQGIHCNEQDKVFRLNLDNLNLNGTLPDSFGNFTELKYLYILGQNPQLHGVIPNSIGSLAQLIDIRIHGRIGLSGSITFLESLYNLEKIRLYDLGVSGPFPDLSNSIGLEEIYIKNTQVYGSIAEGMTRLENLKTVWMFENKLSGSIPSGFGQLSTSLQDLRLYTNRLTGSIPDSLGLSIALETLQLEKNQLNGSIPVSFGSLRHIKNLTLFMNKLTGSIPEFTDTSELTQLYLFTNQLSGQIPTSIGSLPKLKELALQDNLLNGQLPESFFSEDGGSNLQNLYLFNNKLSGSIPASFTKLVNLIRLVLHSNMMTGGLGVISSLKNLSVLVVNHNRFSGARKQSIYTDSHSPLLHVS